jgi:hypothetical protein
MKLSVTQLRGIIKEELAQAAPVNEGAEDWANNYKIAPAIRNLTESIIAALRDQPGPSGSNFDDTDIDGIHVELENALNQAVNELVPQFWS